MDRETVLRRAVHVSTPAFLAYYLLPDPLWEGGVTRAEGLLIVLAVVLVFEAARLGLKIRIPGMREYEYRRMSAAAWAALGMVFAFLFFPFEYAAPAFLGMGWVDPLIGELRESDSPLYPWLPTIVYFLLVLTTLSLLVGIGPGVFVASLAATMLGIGAERLRTRYVDDDFLMLVVPLIAIAIVLEAI